MISQPTMEQIQQLRIGKIKTQGLKASEGRRTVGWLLRLRTGYWLQKASLLQ